MESHHESSHHNNSAHWSSIVDPYSAHGPAISVHDGKLYKFPATLDASNDGADGDPIRQPVNQEAASTSPCMPQHMPLEDTNNSEKPLYDGKPSTGPRGWYVYQKESDWYGLTVRTANKTPLHVLGYQSDHDEDDCSDSCSDNSKPKIVKPFSEEYNKDIGIGTFRNEIGVGTVRSNPNAASFHTTIAARNDDSDSNSNFEQNDANDDSNGNSDKCVDCFFGLSWLRHVFRHNGNLIHTNHNIIQ